MNANLEIDKGGVPPEFLKGTITFIADYPASRSAIQKYFPDEGRSLQLNNNNYYEVRASLVIGTFGNVCFSKRNPLFFEWFVLPRACHFN